jgi:hypothetical protein
MSWSSGKKLVEDANLQNVAGRIGCVMGNSNKILTQILETALETPQNVMAKRRALIGDLVAAPASWSERFAAAATAEKECDDFVGSKGAGADELQKDSLGQLIFTSPDWAPFNYIPYMLIIISYFKRFFVPATILLFPIGALILPYILLRWFYNLPISYSQYFTILKTLWIGKNGSFTNPQSLIQLVFTVFSFAQSIMEPLKQALHLHKTDRVILSMGNKFLALVAAVRAFQADCTALGISKKLMIGFEDIPTTAREATAFFLDQPERLAVIKTDLAELEIFWRFSQTPSFKHVRFLGAAVGTPQNFFRARGLSDISLFDGKKSDCIFAKGKNHVVLTGPNGGGKSSFLRSLIQAALFSHSIGMATTDELTLRPIAWIASGVRLHDSPGKLSMFETEVKFAADVLRRSKNSQNGFVLFDELFHSTNPPDGEKTSMAFLNELWKSESVMSIVSTHMFSLADATVQKWCFTATEANGRLVYDYTLKRGVCRLSSVKDIWDSFGFTSACGKQASQNSLTE